MDLPVGPGQAGGAVLALDVVLAPADLGLRAGEPVRSRGGHLGTRAGLRDPVGAGRIPGQFVPLALARPDVVEAAELARLAQTEFSRLQRAGQRGAGRDRAADAGNRCRRRVPVLLQSCLGIG